MNLLRLKCLFIGGIEMGFNVITVHPMVSFVFCSSASADINVLSAGCLPLVSDPKLISHIFAGAVIFMRH